MLKKNTRTGVSHRRAIGPSEMANAAQFRVSIKFVNDMVLLKLRTGSLVAKPQGNGGGHGKLAGVAGWIERRQPFMRNMLTRMGLIDVEAGKGIDPGNRFPRRGSLKTNMAKTTGWSPCGARLIDHAPFGQWKTQTPDQVSTPE